MNKWQLNNDNKNRRAATGPNRNQLRTLLNAPPLARRDKVLEQQVADQPRGEDVDEGGRGRSARGAEERGEEEGEGEEAGDPEGVEDELEGVGGGGEEGEADRGARADEDPDVDVVEGCGWVVWKRVVGG